GRLAQVLAELELLEEHEAHIAEIGPVAVGGVAHGVSPAALARMLPVGRGVRDTLMTQGVSIKRLIGQSGAKERSEGSCFPAPARGREEPDPRSRVPRKKRRTRGGARAPDPGIARRPNETS